MAVVDKEDEERAKLRFKWNPKAVCNAAREGSHPDIIAVVEALEGKQVPVHHRLRGHCVGAIIDAIPHLGHQLECYDTDRTRPWYVMMVVVSFMWNLEPGLFETRKKLEEKWISVLPHLSSWVVVTLSMAFNDDPLSDVSCLTPAFNTIRFVYQYVHENPACEDPLQTGVALRLITAIWLRPAPTEQTELASQILARIFTGHTCDEHTTPGYAGKRRIMLDTASELNLSAVDVMDLALTRIGGGGEGVAAHFDALDTLIIPSPQTTQKEHLVFQEAFVAQHGVSIVLKAIRKVFSDIGFDFRSPDGSILTEERAAVISRGIRVLLSMLCCQNSWVVFKKALKSDLLRILAFASTPSILSRLESGTDEVIRELLKNRLAGSLVVRQVLLSVRKTVEKYRTLAPCLDDGEMPFQLSNSDLCDAWDLLFSNLRHHSRSLKVFSYERKLEEVACENESCSKQGARSNFRKCAGCEVSYFCSSACQETAWRRHNHKEQCIRAREQRDFSGLSIKDLDYIARDAREAVRKTYYPTLQSQRKEGHETFSERALAICYSVKGVSGSFHIQFFDWESTKRDENPLVYRLGHGDKSDIRIATARRPYDPKTSDINDDRDEEEEDLVVRVDYVLGFEMRSIYFSAPFSKALLEGRLCACCRFHDELRDHGKSCLVHK